MDIELLNKQMPAALKGAGINISPKWVNSSAMYSNSTVLYIGKIPVAKFFYDGGVARDSQLKYKVTSGIPGIKPDLGHFLNEQQASAMCLKVAETFIKMLSQQKE